MKVLLHTCCAPCLCGSRLAFQNSNASVTALWFNPNIHPFSEFDRRLQAFQRYLLLDPIDTLTFEEYDLWKFIFGMTEASDNGKDEPKGAFMRDYEKKRRCQYCYNLRLQRTAEIAKERGFDAFSTTMLISPHQQQESIRKIANNVAKRTGIKFHYVDLRNFWKDSIRISKELRIYRQSYCGCVFSEHERYMKR